MSGLSAGIVASQSGIGCTIVEKGPHLGGSARYSAGMFWAPKDIQAFLKAIPLGEPDLQTKFLSEYPSAVRWMKENGVPVNPRFEPIMSIGHSYPIDIHAWLSTSERIIRSNPRSKILLDTTAVELVRESPGVEGSRVTGAILRGSDNSIVNIKAKAVIIGTGGFAGSPQLVSQYIGPGSDDIFVRTNPYSKGDGFRLAQRAGTGTSRGMSTFYGHLFPSPLHQRDVDPSQFLQLAQFQSVDSIMVNSRGKRFCDETLGDEVNNQELARQPGRKGYLILNESIRLRYAGSSPFPNAGTVDRIEQARAAGGNVVSASTVSELVSKMAEWGVPSAALEKTLYEYNQAVDSSNRGAFQLDAPIGGGIKKPHKELVDRDAPLWAVEVQPTITFPYGGLKIDTSARALTVDGRTIPGLYISGVDAGGFSNWRYGGGLALAFITGRWAAQAAILDQELKGPNERQGALL